MSRKIAQCVLMAVILITPTAWGQSRPRTLQDRNMQLRGRENPQRNAQMDVTRQMAETEAQIKKLRAEQRKLNADLKAIQTLATEEKAKKTLSKVNELLKARNAEYNAQLTRLNQRLQRTKNIVANYAKRNQAQNRINTVAPAFSATTASGDKINSKQYKGKVIVLEWLNPECQFTQYGYQRGKVVDLAKQYAKNKDVVWLGVSSTKLKKPSSLSDFIEQFKIVHPVINDASGQIARLYYAQSTPHFMVVGKDGKIAYSGAFDNSLPKPKDGKITGYVANALKEVLEGKPVTIPTISPAGTPINAGRQR
jgi:peroxiredoxin